MNKLKIVIGIFLIIIGGLIIMCKNKEKQNLISEAMSTKALSQKEKDIALIASYTATGNMPLLENAIKQGLDNGLTINEVKEILIQMYAYCGFPRSLNALNVLMNVAKSGNYTLGDEGKALPLNANKNQIGEEMQTKLSGRKVSGGIFDFAPTINDYLKEHLFADIFSRGILSNQEREIATISALASMNGVESQLNSHINIGKNTGLSQEKTNDILYLATRQKLNVFDIGDKNDAYAKYFKGQSYLKRLSKDQVSVANVSFEPKSRNNWHIHHKGGQILLITGGNGYYQEWGKPAVKLKKGDVVNIPAETKHWHGASKDSWFSHIAIEVPSENGSTEWLEEVSDEEYNKLN